MKYKVGDKVRIKSLDWYNENKDEDGNIPLIYLTNSKYNFIKRMRVLCGKVMTISSVNIYSYEMVEDNGEYFWTDEMIERLVEETKFGTASNPIEPKSNANSITQSEVDVIEKAKTYWDSIKDAWICPEGYIFKDENGNVINATKIVLEKKKKEYPKTYEECCKILNLPVRDLDILDNMLDTTEIVYNKNLDRLLNSFRKLLICRDAYWTIYGEENGLGKPWEPDYDSLETKYTIEIIENKVVVISTISENHILAFPTEEMRDAFYENFKELIEICKELL